LCRLSWHRPARLSQPGAAQQHPRQVRGEKNAGCWLVGICRRMRAGKTAGVGRAPLTSCVLRELTIKWLWFVQLLTIALLCGCVCLRAGCVCLLAGMLLPQQLLPASLPTSLTRTAADASNKQSHLRTTARCASSSSSSNCLCLHHRQQPAGLSVQSCHSGGCRNTARCKHTACLSLATNCRLAWHCLLLLFCGLLTAG
jgi:hypothetical protein